MNADLGTQPDAVNSQPHESWMIKVKVANPGESAGLLDAAQYDALTQ